MLSLYCVKKQSVDHRLLVNLMVQSGGLKMSIFLYTFQLVVTRACVNKLLSSFLSVN